MGHWRAVSISKGSRVALDTPVLIYALERHPDFGPASLAILRRIEAGDITACASVLVLTEFLTAIHARFDAAETKKIRSA